MTQFTHTLNIQGTSYILNGSFYVAAEKSTFDAATNCQLWKLSQDLRDPGSEGDAEFITGSSIYVKFAEAPNIECSHKFENVKGFINIDNSKWQASDLVNLVFNGQDWKVIGGILNIASNDAIKGLFA